MFGWGRKKRSLSGQTSTKSETLHVPTVKFDPARITETVKADLKQNIRSIDEVGADNVDMIYAAALRSISSGRALHILCQALMGINGMEKWRAEKIARLLNNKASALIHAEEQERIGVKYALWRYSGAPCGNAEQDAAHKAANGKSYLVTKGMFLGGRWTRPGRDDGCKCISQSIIAGFDGHPQSDNGR